MYDKMKKIFDLMTIPVAYQVDDLKPMYYPESFKGR